MPDGTIRLLVAAAPAEGRAVLRAFGASEAAAEVPWTLHPLDKRHDLVVSGIGKANAAGAVARVAGRHGVVLSVGVAGTLPGGPPLLSLVSATACCFADEGLETGEGFMSCSQMGFPIAPAPFAGNSVPVPPEVAGLLGPLAGTRGIIATVSTCSGTDDLARSVAGRTGAVAETMEGAAVAVAAVRLGLAFGELRVISNTTGDRARQQWDLKGALARLTDVIGRLRALP